MKASLIRDEVCTDIRLLSANMSEAIHMQVWSNSKQFLHCKGDGLVYMNITVLLVHRVTGKLLSQPSIAIDMRTCEF